MPYLKIESRTGDTLLEIHPSKMIQVGPELPRPYQQAFHFPSEFTKPGDTVPVFRGTARVATPILALPYDDGWLQ